MIGLYLILLFQEKVLINYLIIISTILPKICGYFFNYFLKLNNNFFLSFACLIVNVSQKNKEKNKNPVKVGL